MTLIERASNYRRMVQLEPIVQAATTELGLMYGRGLPDPETTKALVAKSLSILKSSANYDSTNWIRDGELMLRIIMRAY
jgi:hypothetical protein